MLIIQRRLGQRIVIGGGIEVHVAHVSRGGVRLGITAPRGISVLRGEVHDAVANANAAAAKASATASEADFEDLDL